ncbi:MAG: T9SS type A sorting domain-containing protein [Bacteroidetes bacterium]|nr:T9SS type A sorting domain-containing protein [Bacteroidota bacterium]
MKKLFLSVILVMFMTGITYSQEILWIRSENVNNIIGGTSVGTDANNNVYVSAVGNYGVWVIKYDHNGMSQFISGVDTVRYFSGMIVTPEGKSFLVGGRDMDLNSRDGALLTYESNGVEIYTQYYNYADRIDNFLDIFVDDNNYAYITGTARDATEAYVLTIKYSPAGAPQWIQRYGHTLDKYNGLKIRVSSSGDVYVTGKVLVNSQQTTDVFVLKYDANGNLLSEFVTNIGGYTDCVPTFALLDDEDNLYVGGRLHTPQAAAGFVIKLIDGNLIWTKIITGPNDGVVFEDAAFDFEGNIILAGGTYDPEDAYYAKISPSGELLFEKTYNGIGNGIDAFMNVVTKGEFIYLCGIRTGQGTDWDYLILKANSYGEKMWETHYNGSGYDIDCVYGIVLDNEDNVIVTGISTEQGGLYCTTIKFSNPLGIQEDEISGIRAPQIYPNPAHAILYIDYFPDNNDAEYIISDISGKIMSTGILNNNPNQGIDIAKYSDGIYLISIEDGLMRFNTKFVKN